MNPKKILIAASLAVPALASKAYALDMAYAMPSMIGYIFIACLFFFLAASTANKGDIEKDKNSVLKVIFFYLGYLCSGGVLFLADKIATDAAAPTVAGLFTALLTPWEIILWLMILLMLFNIIEEAIEFKNEKKMQKILGKNFRSG